MAGRFYASFLLVLTITLGVSPANQQYKNKIVIFFTQFSAFLMMGLHTFFDLVPFHVFRDSIEHVSLLSIAIFHMHKIFERQAATTILWFTLSTVKHFTSVSGHLHYFFFYSLAFHSSLLANDCHHAIPNDCGGHDCSYGCSEVHRKFVDFWLAISLLHIWKLCINIQHRQINCN